MDKLSFVLMEFYSDLLQYARGNNPFGQDHYIKLAADQPSVGFRFFYSRLQLYVVTSLSVFYL